MKSHVFGLALLSAIAIGAGAPAQAQSGSLTRSFVSSAGADSNACTIAAPCASFAQAYTKVGANGIVAALDSGKYGPLIITGPVTINGNGWSAITAPAGGNGITINAGSTDNVTLTGLEIDGAGAALNGIVFNSGRNLVVRNCVLKDFVTNFSNGGFTNGTTGNGIWIAPASGTIAFTIVDTIVSKSEAAGIKYQPQNGSSATGIGGIDHVVVIRSDFGGNLNSSGGIVANTASASGGLTVISVSNSVISNNTGTGARGVFMHAVSALGRAPTAMTLDNDEISYNANGVVNEGGTIALGRSTITNNSNVGINNTGTIDTFQNNQISANGTNIAGTALINRAPQ
jgi:hypothetical protein